MRYAIGIDFGGTTIKTGLVGDGKILERGGVIDTQHFRGPEAILEAVFEVINQIREIEPKVEAIGIGLPGLVDSVHGIVHELTNVEGWNDVALREIIKRETGLFAIVENDANAMAYGEFRYGAAVSGRNVVCVTLGTGVGGALILDGALYRGAQLGAGEIGHMSIDYRGKPGPYGNFGGLEEYVGNVQISERARERYKAAGIDKALAECTPLELTRAAETNDPVALQMWNDLGDEVGAALANVVWLLNPDTIVIGGGVAKAGALIFDPIIRSVNGRTQRIIHEHLRIVPAALGNDAGIIGNAALALESVRR